MNVVAHENDSKGIKCETDTDCGNVVCPNGVAACDSGICTCIDRNVNLRRLARQVTCITIDDCKPICAKDKCVPTDCFQGICICQCQN